LRFKLLQPAHDLGNRHRKRASVIGINPGISLPARSHLYYQGFRTPEDDAVFPALRTQIPQHLAEAGNLVRR